VQQVVSVLEVLNIVAFTGLALLALREWLRRRDAAILWAALAFATLSFVTIVGRLIPSHPSELVAHTIVRLDIAVLLVFPYLLYRFTTTFDPPGRRVTLLCNALTVAMVVATFAVPSFPEEGESWSAGFAVYVVAFFAHWVFLSSLAAARLWRGGREQPSVARKRMRMLAAAAGGLTVALFLAVGASDSHDGLQAATQLLALLTAVMFALGISPPQLLRQAWRRPEQQQLSHAIESLMTLATTREEIVERVLQPMADIVGARAVELRDEAGTVLGTFERPARQGAPTERLSIDVPGGTVAVWTTTYAPFFGESELELVRTLGALTGIALDRVRLFVQEHESRLALERANDVMANFVALAAHELRTPVTTIHGFVHTLNHLSDRLTDEQQQELRTSLEQQTVRMASLVEQLLDLSRLDAEAVEIAPERFRVRDKLADLVGTAAAGRTAAVTVDVDDELEAEADPNAFDRIVTNLITNAFRYGEPPVYVRARSSDNHFYVVVEDRGGGVAPDFVPNLFERFSRSEGGRARAGGTGLGLAIARSYARAHGGDLLYHPADPHGACFELLLPSDRRRVGAAA
jgi:signal transduction histidine kinase